MKMKRIIYLVFFLLLIGLTAYADIPIRRSNNPDKDCAVAYNSQNDEYLVVWSEWGSTTGTTSLPVMGQRVKGDGSGLIGGAFEVLPGGAYPAVAYNSQTNEYFVTASIMGSIVGRGVTNAGAVKNNYSVLMGSGSYAIWSRIIYNSLGNNYLLVGAELIDVGNGLSNIKISTRIIDANGQLIGSEHLICEQGHGTYADGARFSIAYAPIQSSETPQGRYLLVIDLW